MIKAIRNFISGVLLSGAVMLGAGANVYAGWFDSFSDIKRKMDYVESYSKSLCYEVILYKDNDNVYVNYRVEHFGESEQKPAVEFDKFISNLLIQNGVVRDDIERFNNGYMFVTDSSYGDRYGFVIPKHLASDAEGFLKNQGVSVQEVDLDRVTVPNNNSCHRQCIIQ